jgi:hypothetical protein
MGSERCASPKVQGSETILCGLDAGHDAGDDGTWHEAIVTDHREMDFGTCHIESDTREAIRWEPMRETLKRGVGRLRRDPP